MEVILLAAAAQLVLMGLLRLRELQVPQGTQVKAVLVEAVADSLEAVLGLVDKVIVVVQAVSTMVAVAVEQAL